MLMPLHSNSNSRKGSVILEIAVVSPVFLLLIAFMLTAISCARADILFSCAVDQVTQELALAVPIAGAGIDIAGEALQYINDASSAAGLPSPGKAEPDAGKILVETAGGAGAVLESLGIEGEDLFGTLLFGEGIRNRIVETFYTYNSSESLLHSRIQNVSVYVNYDESDKVIWLNVYYQWNTLFGAADKKIVSAVPVYGDLVLKLPEISDETSKQDEVWLLSNFERGYSLRTTFGGNLPTSYPVIAKWDNGTATSIKSIDLTAPGYQIEGTLTKSIEEYTDDLSGFQGTDVPWGKDNIVIGNEEITERVLVIVIPENSPDEVYNELMSGTAYASTCGVQIRIENYGNSYRYISRDAAGTAEAGAGTAGVSTAGANNVI